MDTRSDKMVTCGPYTASTYWRLLRMSFRLRRLFPFFAQSSEYSGGPLGSRADQGSQADEIRDCGVAIQLQLLGEKSFGIVAPWAYRHHSVTGML